MVPVLPASPSPGRPKPRYLKDPSGSGSSDVDRWRALLEHALGLADNSDTAAFADVLNRCAIIAAQLQKIAADLTSICRSSTLDEGSVKIAVLDNLFGTLALGQHQSQLDEECISRHGSAPPCMTSHVEQTIHMDGGPEQVYVMAAKVGEGTFGTVCKAMHRVTGQTHAVKTVPKHKIEPEKLWSEIEVVKQLDHPHILRLYATFEDTESIYMATEICSGGEFFDTIERQGRIDELDSAPLIRQILSAVIYIHGKTICHRDLKPENFLVAKTVAAPDMELKLIDFGTAKNFTTGQLITKVCTANYVAPEVLKRGEIPYTEKVDVWSCGVIVYMMFSGCMPFEHENNMELMKLVKKGKYDLKPAHVWENISDEAIDLVKNMLCLSVPKRLSSAEAFKHEWFTLTRVRKSINPMRQQAMMEQMTQYLRGNRLKRVALNIIAHQVDDEQIAKLRNDFVAFDSDLSGTLTCEEMGVALRRQCVDEKIIQKMQAMAKQLDEDGSGVIEYTEFVAATISPETYLQEKVCKAAFNILDVDKDGVISRMDLTSLLHSANPECQDTKLYKREEISRIMNSLDENGDERIDFAEFMALMSDDGAKTE